MESLFHASGINIVLKVNETSKNKLNRKRDQTCGYQKWGLEEGGGINMISLLKTAVCYIYKF